MFLLCFDDKFEDLDVGIIVLDMQRLYGCRKKGWPQILYSTNPSIFKGYIAVLQSILGEECFRKESPVVVSYQLFPIQSLSWLLFAHLAQDKDTIGSGMRLQRSLI